MIYFIEDVANGHVKIGYAKNPWSRLATFRVSSASQLDLVAVAPGDRQEEVIMHTRFASYRIRGEWFRKSSPIEEMIATLGPPTNPHDIPVRQRLTGCRDMRVALAELGISQVELAALLGKSPKRVTEWIKADGAPPEVRLFCRVAKDHGLDYAKEALRA